MASYSSITSGSLVPREYAAFRGVDFSNKDVSLYRSPDSLNMWKDYKNDLGKSVETRPDIDLLHEFDETIFGLFFYKVGSREMILVHSGTKLYKIQNETTTEIKSGMNPVKSQSFIYNNVIYIKDGINYFQYDGSIVKDVVGYVPTTTIAKSPSGAGETYQDVNMLSDYRINTFYGDGESKTYQLDVKSFDDEVPVVTITKLVGETYQEVPQTYGTDFTYDRTKGTVTFIVAPDVPYNESTDNVKIKFKKHVEGYADRIKKCTILEVFDNRVFFSGNENFPNVVWHSSLDEPTYVSDTDYYNEGLDLSPVKSMIAGNNALWVFKEPSQANTTVFYHNPVIENDSKIYPSTHSSVSTGCIATGRNFNDDIVFFSDRGMEAISGDVTTEQVIAHRSSLVDARLLNENNYTKMVLEEYEGYLFVMIGNKVYLADSRGKYTQDDHVEYEWFYWELKYNNSPVTITCSAVINGKLYIGTTNGIYTLKSNSENSSINSYWTTPEDTFKAPRYVKTTNKRGCVISMTGDEITVSTKTDNNEFEVVDTYTNTKDYVVSRIKRKKWRTLQMKLSSTKPFGLFSVDIEAYVGSYVKR